MKRVVIFVIQHNKMTISFSFLFFSYSTFHFLILTSDTTMSEEVKQDLLDREQKYNRIEKYLTIGVVCIIIFGGIAIGFSISTHCLLLNTSIRQTL